MTNLFKYFNSNNVFRSQNLDVDLLANTASKLIPHEGLSLDTFLIELICKPSIIYNVTNWKVFDDYQQILYFLTAWDTFKCLDIDEDEHEKYLSDPNFPSKIIPKSVINLEKYYDLQDKFKGNPNCKT